MFRSRTRTERILAAGLICLCGLMGGLDFAQERYDLGGLMVVMGSYWVYVATRKGVDE